MRKTAEQQEQDAFTLIEKKFNLKIIHPGDALNFPKLGDSVAV